jgi:hypothetical protein
MSSLNPAYVPGEFVYLACPVPGFAEGTRFKIVSSQTVSAGVFRYQLSALGQTVWAAQDDLRQNPPASVTTSPASQLPDRSLSMTHRMQSLTLAQRMAALGVNNDDPEPGLSATRRMGALDPDALPTTVPDPTGPITGMPDLSGPITGGPVFDGKDKRSGGKR